MASLLIVDDEEVLRDTLVDTLSQHLCDVAGTVEEALAYLDMRAYDTILTDISLPGMSGLELLAEVRLRQTDTPVIVMTGIADREYLEGLVRMGAFHYLAKPFDVSALDHVVTQAVEHRRWLLTRHTPTQKSDPADARALRGLERQWSEAYLKNDPDLLRSVLADEFTLTNAFGETKNRSQTIASARADLTLGLFERFDIRVDVFGDTGVATGRFLARGRYQGRDIAGQYRYANTYARKEGGWQMISSHVARIDAPL